MKSILNIIVAVGIISLVNSTYGQVKKCDSLSNELLDVDPSFKNNGTDVLQFFNDKILKIISENYQEDFPPTSFKMVLIINDQDAVESIDQIRGEYSDEMKSISPPPKSFSAPARSRIVRESTWLATCKAIREVMLALINPVITSTEGRCVDTIKWIPVARAI